MRRVDVLTVLDRERHALAGTLQVKCGSVTQRLKIDPDALTDQACRVEVPEPVAMNIDGIWQHHIADKHTGLFNRHDDGRSGCDFAFSGGSFIDAFAFMHKATGDATWLDRARLVADWHFSHRNKATGLVADCPGLHGTRYDGSYCFTTVVGPYAIQLIKASEFSGDERFADMAISYIKAFDRYAWDAKAGTYFGAVSLEGQPVREGPQGHGYDRWLPTGHVDIWRGSMFSYEFPLAAALAAVYAYEWTRAHGASGDAALLSIKTSRRWTDEYARALPRIEQTGGGHAEHYARAISFFVHMHRATGEQRYLQTARRLGDEAIRKFYVNGLFRGHPAKPYYEAVDGVGLLLWALTELQSPDKVSDGAY
jgi:hypothetical protein